MDSVAGGAEAVVDGLSVAHKLTNGDLVSQAIEYRCFSTVDGDPFDKVDRPRRYLAVYGHGYFAACGRMIGGIAQHDKVRAKLSDQIHGAVHGQLDSNIR